MDCAQGQREDLTSEQIKCTKCRKTSTRITCTNPDHHNFWVHKCRYCCSPAKWFCFGNTHFCTKCHDRAGDFRDMDISQLPQCSGPLHCPLKIEHPPNGEEFVISCQLCQEEHERDPEVTQRIKRFESQQRIKRTIIAVVSGFLHFVNWFILLGSLIYSTFYMDMNIKQFLIDTLFACFKVLPLLILTVTFLIQLSDFFYPRRGHGSYLFKRIMFVPYILVALWMYWAGTLSFSLFVLLNLFKFSLFISRILSVTGAICYFIMENFRYTKLLGLVGAIGYFDIFRYYFDLSFNPLSTIIQLSISLIIILHLIITIIRMLQRKRIKFPFMQSFWSVRGVIVLVLFSPSIFSLICMFFNSFGYLLVLGIR